MHKRLDFAEAFEVTLKRTLAYAAASVEAEEAHT
jgi:hypothetical protein